MSRSPVYAALLADHRSDISWTEFMQLQEMDNQSYRSIYATATGTRQNANGEQEYRGFGGHVMAQATYAASKTVEETFQIHSVTAHFIALSLAQVANIYNVRTIRNGRRYAMRTVEVVASGSEELLMIATVSFKIAEPQFLDISESISAAAEQHLTQVTAGKNPSTLPQLEQMEYTKTLLVKEPAVTSYFTGISASVLPNKAANKSLNPIERKYSTLLTLNEAQNAAVSPTLKACALIFHSDRDSIWSVLEQYEMVYSVANAGSLMISFVLHVPAARLAFAAKDGAVKSWYHQQYTCKRLCDGRALIDGKVYDDSGIHVASFTQEAMIQLAFDAASLKRHEQKIKEKNARPKSIL